MNRPVMPPNPQAAQLAKAHAKAEQKKYDDKAPVSAWGKLQ